METLKDIVEELNKIPKDILDSCKFGIGEDSDDTISLIIFDDNFCEIFEKYPALIKLNHLIQNIIKAQAILDEQGKPANTLKDILNEDEGLTDNFFEYYTGVFK